MEDLLALEYSAEQHVLDIVAQSDVPLQAIIDAFATYRPLAEAVIFADYQNAERTETMLWQTHLSARQQFSKRLRDMRKNSADRPVETRILAKAYLRFLKDSEQHYRNFLTNLALASGGDPDLVAVARSVKGSGIGESQHMPIPPNLLPRAHDHCHRTLVYLGDLSRYRVESELDSKPSYAPTFGYYELAAAFRPSSGIAHHQQAIVSLKLKDHLNGIYSLYRSITVANPFPLAPKNLLIEVDRTNTAWDKKELIPKGLPNDPNASKHNLVGWFIRMHSMCFKCERLSSHAELEREVFSQLANVIKQRDLERTLLRMVLIGIAAQYCAGERYKDDSTNEALRDSYLLYLRSNIRMFTTLSSVFYEDLRSSLLNMDNQDVELAMKLTTIGRRLLPSLRVLSNWLLSTIKMVAGLAYEPMIQDFIPTFWASYAKAVDLIAQAFPIWDLEDLPELTYLLDEDATTLEFLPLSKDMHPRTRKTWFNMETGAPKHRVSDGNVVRGSVDDEMLQRVKDFLADGVNLANDDDGPDVPIHLRGTRVFYGDERNIEQLVVRPPVAPIAPPKPEKAKPVSYASIAATAHAQRKPRPMPPPQQAKTAKTQSRDAQLSQMVDDLVDDDETNNPATPPQQLVSNPAVVSNGEVQFALQDSVHDLSVTIPKYAHQTNGSMDSRHSVTLTPPGGRPISNIMNATPGNHERLQSLSKIWNAPEPSSSFFPSGLPTGTLGSPPMDAFRGHSRVNSTSSARSRNSLNVADSWDSAPRILADNNNNMTYGSPLLFGAGGGTWSTPYQGYNRNGSPPNGQGG